MKTPALITALAAVLALAACKDAPSGPEQPFGDRALAFTGELANLVDQHKDDCQSMGEAVHGFVSARPDMVAEIEKRHGTDEHARWLAEHRDAYAEIGRKMAPVARCLAESPELAEAMGLFDS